MKFLVGVINALLISVPILIWLVVSLRELIVAGLGGAP